VVLCDDEHRHLDDGITVGEVGFDPEARPSHDPDLVLGDEDPRPWFVQEFFEPRPYGLFRGRRITDRLGQLAGETADLRSVLDVCFSHLILGAHATPHLVFQSITYPTERSDERMKALR
jgi:hypothetical protein